MLVIGSRCQATKFCSRAFQVSTNSEVVLFEDAVILFKTKTVAHSGDVLLVRSEKKKVSQPAKQGKSIGSGSKKKESTRLISVI